MVTNPPEGPEIVNIDLCPQLSPSTWCLNSIYFQMTCEILEYLKYPFLGTSHISLCKYTIQEKWSICILMFQFNKMSDLNPGFACVGHWLTLIPLFRECPMLLTILLRPLSVAYNSLKMGQRPSWRCVSMPCPKKIALSIFVTCILCLDLKWPSSVSWSNSGK